MPLSSPLCRCGYSCLVFPLSLFLLFPVPVEAPLTVEAASATTATVHGLCGGVRSLLQVMQCLMTCCATPHSAALFLARTLLMLLYVQSGILQPSDVEASVAAAMQLVLAIDAAPGGQPVPFSR